MVPIVYPNVEKENKWGIYRYKCTV